MTYLRILGVVLLVLVSLGLLFNFSTGLNWVSKQDPFYANIERLTVENRNYRKVLYTTNNMQLVLMSLLPGEEIGMEVHPAVSQFFRVESGKGLAVIAGKQYPLENGDVVVVAPGTQHNFINIHHSEPLQMYTIYTPPNYSPGTLQPTKPKND